MRKIISLILCVFICSSIHSRNWNVIADSICSKQKIFTDSVLAVSGGEYIQNWRDAYKRIFEEGCRLRKMKMLTAHFDSVSHDRDTLYFIDCYKFFVGGFSPFTIFFVKSKDYRGRLLYHSSMGQTSSWEYLYSFIDLMKLCNEWDLKTVKKLSETVDENTYFGRGETCFTRIILLPDDKFLIDVFNFDSI